MAALQKIRNKAGLLIGVIAVALLAFIFPWNEVMSMIQKRKDKAFVVDGDIISTGAYQERIIDFETFQKLVSGQSSLDENTTSQIREFVYEQMVKEIMLDKEAKKIGLNVTSEEVNEMLTGNNPSPMLRQIPLFVDPKTGQFSPDAVKQFVALIGSSTQGMSPDQIAQLENLKSVWSTISNMVKYQKLEEKYNLLITNSILVNEVEINASKEAATATANMAYVLNRYSSVPDSSVQVTDKEIEKLYSERKSNFKTQNDLRKITYFAKKIVPSEADYTEIQNEANTAYEKLSAATNPALIVADYSEVPYQDVFYSEKNLSPEENKFVQEASVGGMYGPIKENDTYRIYKLIDKTVSPDSVKLSMIVIPEGIDKIASNAKADSIINVIKQGKDFAVVANEILPQSNGGQIGWVTEPQLASAGKEFVDAAFKTASGDIAKLNLQGQIQIIKVESKTQPINKYKLAYIQIPVNVSDQTLNSLDNELNEFVAKNGNQKDFIKAANEAGYNLIENALISGSNQNIDQMGGSRQIVFWAFHEKPGSVKKFDLNDYRVVAMVNSKIDDGYMPLSDVKDLLKGEILKDKKAEKMIAEMKSKNFTSLDQYSQSLDTKVDTVNFVTFNTPNIMGIGPEYALNVIAEVGTPDKLEGPIQGNNGVLVVKVLNKTDESKNFNLESFIQTSNNQNLYRVMSQSMQVMKEKLGVKDNRIAFF